MGPQKKTNSRVSIFPYIAVSTDAHLMNLHLPSETKTDHQLNLTIFIQSQTIRVGNSSKIPSESFRASKKKKTSSPWLILSEDTPANFKQHSAHLFLTKKNRGLRSQEVVSELTPVRKNGPTERSAHSGHTDGCWVLFNGMSNAQKNLLKRSKA